METWLILNIYQASLVFEVSEESSKDTKRQHQPRARAGQKRLRQHLQPYHQTVEQIISSDLETHELIIHTPP